MKPKSISKLKAKLWDQFALFIKIKHSANGYCRCYTCGKPLKIGTSDCQAGHYYSQGGFPALRFNEDNVRPQCYRCNVHLNGNTQIFGENLRKEIGESRFAFLNAHRHDTVKLSSSELIEKIEHYKELNSQEVEIII